VMVGPASSVGLRRMLKNPECAWPSVGRRPGRCPIGCWIQGCRPVGLATCQCSGIADVVCLLPPCPDRSNPVTKGLAASSISPLSVITASGSVRTCYYLHWLCALAQRDRVSSVTGAAENPHIAA
jgi:hypothetical protein